MAFGAAARARSIADYMVLVVLLELLKHGADGMVTVVSVEHVWAVGVRDGEDGCTGELALQQLEGLLTCSRPLPRYVFLEQVVQRPCNMRVPVNKLTVVARQAQEGTYLRAGTGWLQALNGGHLVPVWLQRTPS